MTKHDNLNTKHDKHEFSQIGNVPIFLKGRTDRFIYRSAMALSSVGIMLTLAGVGMMATGLMRKK